MWVKRYDLLHPNQENCHEIAKQEKKSEFVRALQTVVGKLVEPQVRKKYLINATPMGYKSETSTQRSNHAKAAEHRIIVYSEPSTCR
ncbi:conserved hypothetical protein [Ricinus communis]|uniref:Uncharacterized protein n=1 Tax=Ricinus communis TaxID=3988 RepID=B9T4S9_RICCO|nr:conserved hypothetical protein [Ricinus communis]